MAVFPPLDKRYDRFLYASVLERDGLPVSVLSALTQQNLDPWEEAARLAGLPRDGAIVSLAATIYRSGNAASQNDANEIALNLVELLPTAASVNSIPPASEDPVSLWLVLGIFLFMIAISTNADREPKTDRAHQVSATVVEQTALPSGQDRLDTISQVKGMAR